MVDLVKIRKKAKEKKESADAQSSGAPATSPASSDAKQSRAAGAVAGAPLEPTAPPIDKIARFLATAGERQIDDVKSKIDTGEELQELLTFRIAEELYAIDIEHVVEIITPRPITRVPNADQTIVGILSLRGAVVTIIDVRRRLGHPVEDRRSRLSGQAGLPVPHDADTRVVVIDENGENLGFIVDRVERVVKVAPSAIEPQPVAHTSEHDESVRGVFRHADALTILLNLENLLTTNGTDL